MKKLIPWALLITLCPLSTVFAADVPARGPGHIQDTAGMFPADRVPQLEESAKASVHPFYILTIESLEGHSSSEYSTSAYKAWGLQQDDILIVLSKTDQRIEMQYHNPQISKQMEQLPEDYDRDGKIDESKIDEFVGKHFTPLAKTGNFAEGVQQLIYGSAVWSHEEEPPALQQGLDAMLSGMEEQGAVLQGGSSSQPSPMPA
ncbi:putative membrane protein YgcG [Paenibacillus mucilaginosus]|uniref:TPM domain-containing protein n=1 Tax=Paenibacillus mucilaginosus TaxID=61624 RepID=UPI003D1C04E6